MIYRNTRTGAVVDVKSKLHGEWVPVMAPTPDEKKPDEKPKPTKKSRKKE